MKYFRVKPQVPGGFGEYTEFSESDGKRSLVFCHLVFDTWPDAIVKNVMAYAVSAELKKMLEDANVSGAEYQECLVTKGDQFEISNPFHTDELPTYFRMIPIGRPRIDDIAREDSTLVVSQKVKTVIEATGPLDIRIEECQYSPTVNIISSEVKTSATDGLL